MISVRPDRSVTPPPSNSRLGIPLEPSAFSSTISTSASPAIVAPKPFHPHPSDDHARLPQQSPGAPSAPSPPPLDPTVSHPKSLSQSVPVSSAPEVSIEFYVDDESLSSVDKIYIFSRSQIPMHRVFISRSLHTFLLGISPLEGVEYVLPLLNILAVDEEDAVKEALVTSLVDIMWWFFENCRLVEDEPMGEQKDPPLLPVQTFTPILGSLLIDHNAMVGPPARDVVVEILNRLHSANDRGEDSPPLGIKERKMLEQEIVHQVIIGMGRLDVLEENFPSPVSKAELTPVLLPPAPPPSSMDKSALVYSSFSPSACQSLSSSTTQLDASDLPTETCLSSSALPALSPSTLLPPESLTGPTISPSQEEPSQVSLPSASRRDVEDHWDTLMITTCAHPSAEATSNDFVTKPITNDDEGWLVADGQQRHDVQDETKEQAAFGRLSSMSLIATVTANAKLPEDTIRAFADEVAYIGGDPLFWVRQGAAFAVGALAKVVPIEVVMLTLLPLFEALIRDTFWQVRRSAVFALPGILTRIKAQHRRTLALNTLLPLSGDVALTVRSGVLEVLGEVIYAFHEDDKGAPPELVSLFVGREQGIEWQQHEDGSESLSGELSTAEAMISPSTLQTGNSDGSPERGETTQPEQLGKVRSPSAVKTRPGDFLRDPARSIITSFNYPAVALSLGPRRWGEVRGYYLTLTREKNVHVRRTIAAGLGEMARILGSELAERDLLDAWQDMVHDAEDGQTRLKALEGVCLFVGALNGPAREGVLAGLVELWEQWLMGWRERQCLILAMPTLAVLADIQGEVVRTLMRKALVDKMAAVREAAIGTLTRVLHAFESRPHLAEALRDDLQGLASMDFCRRRATYVACYCALVEGEQGKAEIARDDFWKRLVPLSQDNVIDVRIGVARLLGVLCDKFYPQPSFRPPRLVEIIRRLSQDPSRDVRAFVAFLLVPEEASQFQHNPTISVTPAMMFATFSRPPPKAPSLIVMVDIQDLGSGDEDSPTEPPSVSFVDRPRVQSPSRMEGEAGPMVSSDKETKDPEQGDIVAAAEPLKPPPLNN